MRLPHTSAQCAMWSGGSCVNLRLRDGSNVIGSK